MSDSDLIVVAGQYAQSRSISLEDQRLGYGSDGVVWKTSRGTALKVHHIEKTYRVELASYRRLRDAKVINICGLSVPELIDSDDSFHAIEMTLVRPPYLLDFGKVYIDQPPPYWGDEQLMENALVGWLEVFGPNWPTVQLALSVLRSHGIYNVDPRPSNINFGDED